MILQKKYTEKKIKSLKKKGIVVLHTDYRIDLAKSYSIYNVKIDERIIVDPQTRMPWFVYFCYSDLTKEKRIKVFEAIEEMYKKSKGRIFSHSSKSDPTIRVNALVEVPNTFNKKIMEGVPQISDEEIMEDVVKSFKDLEALIQND